MTYKEVITKLQIEIDISYLGMTRLPWSLEDEQVYTITIRRGNKTYSFVYSWDYEPSPYDVMAFLYVYPTETIEDFLDVTFLSLLEFKLWQIFKLLDFFRYMGEQLQAMFTEEEINLIGEIQ